MCLATIGPWSRSPSCPYPVAVGPPVVRPRGSPPVVASPCLSLMSECCAFSSLGFYRLTVRYFNSEKDDVSFSKLQPLKSAYANLWFPAPTCRSRSERLGPILGDFVLLRLFIGPILETIEAWCPCVIAFWLIFSKASIC